VLEAWFHYRFVFQCFATGDKMIKEFIGDVLAATYVKDFELEAMAQCFPKVGNFQFFLVHQGSVVGHKSMLSGQNWPLETSSSHHGKSVDAKVRKRNRFIFESVEALVS